MTGPAPTTDASAGAAVPWPVLRDELSLLPGPPTRDGAPTWSLHDPARNLFFRLDWLTFEVLSRWHLGQVGPAAPAVGSEAAAAAIVADIAAHTTLRPSAADLQPVLQFLAANELTQRRSPQASAAMAQQLRARRQSWSVWLLHHYLFFRVPLWRPDAWLGRVAPHLGFFFSRGFALLTLTAMALGLLQVSRQWPTFMATLLDTFSWQGLLGYGLCLAAVKFLHELGHAVTAKRLGCRVPTMGVAFLVMFPMAYTDVNEVWKLSARRQRLAVGAAGIVTELVVAAWATLAWALLPEGSGLRNAAFLLATTTWVSTLLINASPFMRFDGYFLLMDALDMPNLHARASGLGRWRLRRMLWGWRDAVPEVLPARLVSGLTLFALATWTYRLVVFLGIAAMVYSAFPKPLGPLLGGVELAVFIVMPFLQEAQVWFKRWGDIVRSPRAWLTVGLLAGGVAALALPWDTRVAAQGVLRPTDSATVVVPGAAVLQTQAVAEGTQVDAGQVLLTLASPDLPFQAQSARARAAGLRWQESMAGVDAKLRDRSQVVRAEADKVASELKGLAQQQDRYTLRAPISGTLFYTQPDLAAGQWLRKDERLAIVADLRRWKVDVYLPESELGRVQVGDTGSFHTEAQAWGAGAVLPLVVSAIDRDATRALPEPLLASTRGGAVVVREQHRQFIPEQAVYRVTLAVQADATPASPQVLRGQVVITGAPKPWLADLGRSAAAAWVREAGF